MNYKISKNGNLIHKKDFHLLDEGCEVRVYRYGNFALKIYKDFSNRTHMSEEEIAYFSTIPSKRILTPKKDALYREDDIYRGYVMDFMGHKENLFNAQLDTIREDLCLMKEDVSLFTSANVRLEDLTVNGFYSSHLYIVDVGNFRKIENDSDGDNKIRLASYNLASLDSLIRYAFLNRYLETTHQTQMYSKMVRFFDKIKDWENYDSLVDVFVQETKAYRSGSVEDYMKGLVKKI